VSVLQAELRNQLERVIIRARETAEAGAQMALEALAVHHHEPYGSMTIEQRALRNRLRAHGRQLGDRRDPVRGTQAIQRLGHECAYEHWHRMLFARFLAENSLLIEPHSGVAITMAECEELAREQGVDPWTLAGRFAQRMLPQIFRPDDPVLQVTLPPETRETLERLLADQPSAVFTADDSLGWTYQFWQSTEKDRVNSRVNSGEKITGQTLPAVTQLFTEHYMVLFLLHNTIGAWHAGRVLSDRPDFVNTLETEQGVRDAVALDGYTFDYLRFIRDRDVGPEEPVEESPWRPAAGTFDAWPRLAKDLRVLDPACGSGHFLVAAFELLVRLRRAEEGLSLVSAIGAVLTENLFGLELDLRCTQIAAFNLALAAWRMAGRVIDLPSLNIACTGLSVGVPKVEWIKLAGDDIRLRGGMERLYALFEQAPDLGSLINPRRASGNDLFSVGFSQLQPLVQQALRRSGDVANEDQKELGVAAQGMTKAAELLARDYHLVITNVPYLARSKQGEVVREFCNTHHPTAKNDLATAFLERCLEFSLLGGTTAIVLPQNWLFLTSYKKFREQLLRTDTWHMVTRLGEGGFVSSAAAGAFSLLLIISHGHQWPDGQDHWMGGLDASEPRQPAEKAAVLRSAQVKLIDQANQLKNPDARVVFDAIPVHRLLARYADALQGISPADLNHYGRAFWEVDISLQEWPLWQSAVDRATHYGGKELTLWWNTHLTESFSNGGAYLRGTEAWGKRGILIRQVRELPCALYSGDKFDTNCAVVVPHNSTDLPAIWCFCSSPEYEKAVRRIDQALKVTNDTLLKVPFDLKHWQGIAAQRYPNGLPNPYSDDPTQWIFHGHPCGSVTWDEDNKWTSVGPLRVDGTVLQVAVARLLGYRWPAETDPGMEICDEARTWARRCEDLLPYAEAGGIVCLSPVRGEEPAADRLRRLLAAAYGDEWSPAKERELLDASGGNGRPSPSLEEWLRDRFFEEHCKIFQHRPFIWHIWDGRQDGFHCLINYHRLAGPDGEGRRTLEAVTYAYLGDWIERQRAEQRENIAGADGRLAAALDLQEQLISILVGEPPYDIFVRWKPLHQQPIGWDPDINDGVRLNIRPFLSAQLRKGGRVGAGILRWKPNVHWNKDRGRELQSLRSKADYPWFWGCEPDGHGEHRTDFMGGSAFDGNRWNDLHYTNRVKQAAQERAAKEAAS
jgi:hypothetical protein